jgi:hypothetical protein
MDSDYIFVKKRAIEISVNQILSKRTVENDFTEPEDDIVVALVRERDASFIRMGRGVAVA